MTIRSLNSKIPGAPSFTYGEFVRSTTATRHGLSNYPQVYQWENIEALASNILQPLRDKFGGIRIHSGYRSPQVNRLVGGSSNSTHCHGMAADIEPIDPNIKLITIFEFIANNFEFRELIAEYFPDGWVHIAYNAKANTKQIKLKDARHNYTLVGVDYVKQLYNR